jgi:non-specific serine/threonine protein kinase
MVAKMKVIDLKMLRLLSSPAIFTEAEKYLQTQKATILQAENETVKATVNLYGGDYSVIICKKETLIPALIMMMQTICFAYQR